MSVRLRAAAALGAGALLLTGVVAAVAQGPARAPQQTQENPAGVRTDALAGSITRLQDHLADVPGDYDALAQLGVAYVERARITVDPTYYPKAEGVLRRSLALRPTGNSEAMVGMGALAAARHDFAGARTWALRARAVNPYDAHLYGVLADAETQLGNADAATRAIQSMLDLRPGVAAYARASYDLEQHGRVGEAEATMQSALDSAASPADIAFCRYYLGELAWNSGRLADAARHYDAGLAADPTYAPLIEGRAKVAAARGDTSEALSQYAQLTNRVPDPSYVMQYGELLQVAGRDTEARAQFDLVDATSRLFAANGGRDGLFASRYAAQHGEKAAALRYARAEWRVRRHALVADALAWALHLNGQDREALTYARKATALGWRNAEFSYHLGMIERSLGMDAAARRDLGAALATNPYFSPIHAPLARQALQALGGAR